MAPISVAGVTGTISTLKTLRHSKSARIAKVVRIESIATCVTRARIRDVAMLLFGLGLGVLLWALIHDFILVRFIRPEPEEQPCPPGCMCEPLPVYKEKEEDDDLTSLAGPTP